MQALHAVSVEAQQKREFLFHVDPDKQFLQESSVDPQHAVCKVFQDPVHLLQVVPIVLQQIPVLLFQLDAQVAQLDELTDVGQQVAVFVL